VSADACVSLNHQFKIRQRNVFRMGYFIFSQVSGTAVAGPVGLHGILEIRLLSVMPDI
jgi:hypothetical protein